MNIILDLYKKWGLFLLQKVTKTQSGKQGSNNRKIVPLSQIIDFFGSQRPYHKLDPLHWAFLEAWYSILQKVTDFYRLLKIHDYDVWFCGNVGVYCFHPIAKW